MISPWQWIENGSLGLRKRGREIHTLASLV